MRKLKHVVQNNEKGCVSACLAMLLDIPVEQVEDEFHEKYIYGKIEIDEYLHVKGMACRPTLAVMSHGKMQRETYYIITAPSLNYPAYLHQLIMYFDDDLEEWIILDPNKGNGHRKYYVNIKDKKKKPGCDCVAFCGDDPRVAEGEMLPCDDNPESEYRKQVELRSYVVEYEAWDR